MNDSPPPTPFAELRTRHWDDRFARIDGDVLGWNALHHACAIGWLDGAARALAAGVPADATTIDACSALDLAITAGADAITTMLLAREDVVAHERGRMYGPGSSAAKRAAERGDVATLVALRAHGCLPYHDEIGMLLVRALVRQQTGSELFVLSAGEEIQFEEPIIERLGYRGELRMSSEAAALLQLQVEHDGELVRRIHTPRFEVVPATPPAKPIAAALMPAPLEPISEVVQLALHGEGGGGTGHGGERRGGAELLGPFEALCGLGCAPVVTWLRSRLQFWTSPSSTPALLRAARRDDITTLLVTAIPDDALTHPRLCASVRETVERGSLTAALALLRRGMPANATPLLAAVVASQRSAHVEPLVSLGADPNLLTQGRTPLLEAIRRMLPEMVEALLRAGANANLPGNPAEIWTHPLGALGRGDISRREHARAIFELLLRAGSNVNFTDTHGRTPLHVERYSDAIAWQVDAGASIELRDDEGFTPLQRKLFDSFPVARALLLYRRGLEQRDVEGNTLVHLACFSAWPDIRTFELLRELGLQLSARNDAGLTPLQRAATPLYGDRPDAPSNREKAMAALRELGAS